MESTLKNQVEASFLHFNNNTITDVSEKFIDLTGFTMEELIGKTISEVACLLRIDYKKLHLNNSQKFKCYILTKTYEMKAVVIFSQAYYSENIYYFEENLKLLTKESVSYVEHILKDNKVGVAIYNVPDLMLLKANKKYLETHNLEENYVDINIGKPLRNRVRGFEKSKTYEVIRNIIKTKEAYYGEELEHVDPKRGVTYWDCTLVPVVKCGKMIYIIATISDVTEVVLNRKIIQKQALEIQQQNEFIRNQKEELEVIIENISDGISIINNEGKHKFFNKNARETFLPPQEFWGNVHDWYRDSELYYLEGDKITEENYAENRVLRGEKFSGMKVTAKFPNKTVHLDVNGTPIYDNNGQFCFGIICNRDMTEYYNQEELLKNRNEFLNRLIDNLELPVITISSSTLKILEINQKALEILQEFRPDVKSTAEIKGCKIKNVLCCLDGSDYSQKINEVVKEKKIKYINKKNHFINGKEVYWNVIFEPVLDQDGELQEILVLIVDITPEIKSNKIMEKALKSQEEFLANISHELKTPLNVIYSTVQLFDMYCKEGSLDRNKDSVIKYIKSMMHNCYRLSKLINNIVDLSKIESGFFELNLSNSNIVEIAEKTIMSVTDYTFIRGLNLFFNADSKEKIIACDPEKIERVLLNLISNAIKFSDFGNKIIVTVEDRNEFVAICVEDNGIGIENNQLNMIFDRFKQVDKSLTRNAEGTGIGLSLVKAIVEMHKGKIYVESVVGKGSKFVVMLPNKKVSQESITTNKKIRGKNENVQVELSDIGF